MQSTTIEAQSQGHKLRVSTAGHVYYLNTSQIVRIESMSNYSRLFLLGGKTVIVSKVLAHFDAILTDFDFVRIHRTHLINLFYVSQFERGNSASIALCTDEVLPVSRSKRKMLCDKLLETSL